MTNKYPGSHLVGAGEQNNSQPIEKMKKIITVSLSLYMGILLALLAVSCDDAIYDKLDPCGLDIQFVYDYNLKYADAFPKEVKKVDLFIFDEQGKYIETITVENDAFPKDYKLHLDLAPGKYQFITWAGLYDKSYTFPKLTPGQSTPEELRVGIKNKNGLVDTELDALWHGILKEITVSGTPNQTVTIPLVKDTNTFRFLLLTSDKNNPINVNKYEFEIVSDNGLYTSQNAIVKGNSIQYTPYYRENLDNTAEGGVNYAGAVVEITTGRLMADQANRLVIRDKSTGKILLDVNLNDFLASLKLQTYSKMPMQEFLDRKDEYVVSFFFTEGTTPEADLMSVRVMIDGWLVREQGNGL